MAFKYKRRDAKTVEKRATQSGSDFQGYILDEFPVYASKKGENWLRVLPPTWDDAEYYGFDVWVHYQVGPDKGTVLCLQKMKNKACPVCEERAKLSAAGDDDEAKELKPGRRVIMFVVDRNEEDKGAQVWPAPWTLDRDIAKVSRNKRTGEMYFLDDPEEGYDLTFEKDGEGVATKYTGVKLDRDPSAAPRKAMKFVMAHPLPEVLRWRDYDEVAEMFAGGGDDDDEDDAPKKKGKRRPVDDDDDDDDEPPVKKKRRPVDDDDDDEDEPPRRKKRPVDDDDDDDDEPPVKKKKRPVDDDDDEDEPPRKKKRKPVDDDDDDDDEPPVKKKKRPIDDDDDDDAPPRSKLRESLAARHKTKATSSTTKKKRPVDDDLDDDEIPF